MEEIDRGRAALIALREAAEHAATSVASGHAEAGTLARFLDIAREATHAQEVLDLIREAERERQENETLMNISMEFSRASSIDTLLRTIIQALERLVRFGAVGIFIYNREIGQIDIDMMSGYDGADEEQILRKFQEGVRVGQGIVGSVIQSNQPIYVPDVRKDPRYIGVRQATRSELAVPIFVLDEVIGALNIEADTVDAFTPRDLRTLRIFAGHAGVALERARADRLRMHTKRIEEEIALARRIQQSFLPRTAPSFAPFDMAGLNEPSSEVGGDYFDFIPITETDMGIAIGDVTGHGIGAALLMATFRACLRIESRNNFAIRTILSKVNDFLYETNPPDAFVTAFYGVLDRKHQVLSYANAGHNPPILLRANGAVEWLWTGGTLLGAFPELDFEETSVRFNTGDLLLLYTDGVTESQDDSEREFGADRLLEKLMEYRKLPAAELVQRIRDEVHAYRGAEAAQDDLTLTVMKYV